MVQKEVMKKTKTYGIIGLLLAVMLVAMIYSYGTTPGISPIQPLPNVSPTESPSGSPLPSPLPSGSQNPAPVQEPEISAMQTFSSYDELKDFLNATSGSQTYYIGATDQFNSGRPLPAPSTAPVQASAPTLGITGSGTKEYSTTNIQVAGVDEADTVKTDGKYLYVIGNNSQVVYIVDANPQSAKVLATILFNNSYLSGIYLSSDGSKLAVLGNQYMPYYVYDKYPGLYSTGISMPYWNSATNFVYVYDVSNKANPVLGRNFTMSGNYVNSRMIGNYVYDIISENAYLYNGTATLPTIFAGSQAYNIAPTNVYYANTSDTYYSYTTIVAMNIMSNSEKASNMTIMMGGTGNIYVSQSNIYITYPTYDYQTLTTPTPSPMTASPSTAPSSSSGITIMPMPIMIRPVWQGTAIYRIHVAGASMAFVAQGNVTGNVLNQYSMDESNTYFRIATTSYDYNATLWTGIQQNNLYVLNSDLKVVGKIENLASGENLHAARFMGNRCYLVTFMKTDPLFVIDLTLPTNPIVLGNLTIPGYSDFLQPYDDTHLIGIGKDAVEASQGNFAWYQGLKLSLFDVSNVNAPTEISKFIIGDRGTSSEALYDPKALLFDYSRNLLVLPVDLYLIDANAGNVPGKIGLGSDSASTYGQFVWQGAYIFNVNLATGFTLRGNVTQMDNPALLLANPELGIMGSYQSIDYNHFISRAGYIDNAQIPNVLYTISQARVQLNSLDNFKLLARIDLD